MTYEDLPYEWDKLPLTDPGFAADVVDLLLADRDRRRDSMLLLFCHDDDTLIQPVVIDGIPWRCSAAARRRTFKFLDHFSDIGVIIAISSSTPIPDNVVRLWLAEAERMAGAGGPALLHFLTALPDAEPAIDGQYCLLLEAA